MGGGVLVEISEKFGRTWGVWSSNKGIVLTCVESECLPRVAAEKLR